MALGHGKRLDISLLDTLLLVKEIIDKLNTQESMDILNNLKSQSEELQRKKEIAEPVIETLKNSKEYNERLISELEFKKEELRKQTINHDEKTKLLLKKEADIEEKIKSHLNSVKDHDNKVSIQHHELNKKREMVEEKEKSAKEIHALATVIKKEYEDKLKHLKNITG